jgi:hypothetical protein
MIEAKRSPESAKSALAKRRAQAEARAKDHIGILRTSAALRRHQHVSDVLERILASGSTFSFTRASDLFQPQPWAVASHGALLGHLLTVDDAVFESVADECLVEILTIPEAFEQEWANLEQRSAWVVAYAAALRSLADEAESNDKTIRDQAELASSTVGLPTTNKSRGGL